MEAAIYLIARVQPSKNFIRKCNGFLNNFVNLQNRYMKYFLLILVTGLASCDPAMVDPVNRQSAWAPVYATAQEASNIGIAASKPTENAGKIYAYQNYIFQVEQGKGIHIINNSNPQQAQKVAFLNLPTCTEIAIKSNFLYSNHLNDLVVFDLSSITSPQLVDRVENAFPQFSQDYPPFSGVFFECPDPAKGVVIGWEEKMVEQPKCRR